MPITQILLTANSALNTGPGSYFQSGNVTNWGSFTIPGPTLNNNFLFPGGSTGLTQTFNGIDQFVTTQLIYSVSQLYLNLWFYPTSSNRIVMTSQGQFAENNDYHHSLLEINSDLTVSGGFWNGSIVREVTTANTVTLNAWNHVYLRYNGTVALLQLNGATAVTDTHSWSSPASQSLPLAIGFGTISGTNMGVNGRYTGSIAEFRLDTANTASNWDATRSIYGL